VNLLGEHTDYNHGFVLPTALPQQTTVELTRRGDRLVSVTSTNAGATLEYVAGEEQRRGEWLDYVRGVTWALKASGFEVPGLDVRISSQVPLGAGLSSSAALEVAMLRALRTELNLPLDDVQIALLGRRVENEFLSTPVGVMDQMACSLCGEGEALFLDTQALSYTKVPLPKAAQLLILDSGITHAHATVGGYRERKRECDQAATLLGVESLRALTDLGAIAKLPEPLDRRVRHVLTENARVLAGVTAMREGDLVKLGALFDASHASQRDDYECSLPRVDALVDMLRKEPGVLGARLTGGGFGGAVVGLLSGTDPAAVGDRVVRAFGSGTRVLLP
jgi:galactokinase